jgi:5-oxopent-3-ene-1,2,5-tricarboxylate decarboxylase/2-hydroxyhepta-2,4-diene-1,7-dioate isomerase
VIEAMSLHPDPMSAPQPRLSGVVYSALLNDPRQLSALGDALHQPPYKAPPRHPVLAVRPRNTRAAPGEAIAVPATGVRTGACLGLVIGRTACRVSPQQALAHVAGWLLGNDLCLPMDGPGRHYRPAVRQMARDGFCPLSAPVPATALTDPDDLPLTLRIDGQPAWEGRTGGRIRSAAQLLSEVSGFMTLSPGDVLLLGIAADAPVALPGQMMSITAPGLGRLDNPLVEETA